MILAEDIYAATNGGLNVLCHFYKEIDPSNPKKPLKLRSDDKRASAGCFKGEKGIWFVKDHGGGDQKAYNAIELVREKMNLEYGEAINWIAQNFAPHLLQSSSITTVAFKPSMKKEAPSTEMRLIKRKSGEFTKAELECLGYKITQKTCDEFGLVPLDGYITKAKGDHSWRIESHDQYPILFYDYGAWGKIYQPYGELRFMYYGEKPKDFIFGTKRFLKYWKDANANRYPISMEDYEREKALADKNKDKKGKDEGDSEEELSRPIKFENLIICSGPSDALNAYSTGNCEVCWLNSESEPLSNNHLEKLKKLCENLFVCFDNDETGLRCAQKIALQDLDVRVIEFPEDFASYSTNKRDSEGNNKPCKDIKDFMVFYKRGQIKPHYEFANRLMKLAKPLKFWTEIISDKGRISYDISNACLFKFLSATGFYKMTVGKDGWRYVFVKDKVIEVIPETSIVSRVRAHLAKFINDNPEYYSLGLENMILRNKVLSADSFQNLEQRSFNLDSFTKTEEYFFFRNVIVRITGDKIEKVNPLDCPYYVLKDKIIQHDLILSNAPFYTVGNSEKYEYAQTVLSQYSPDTPEYSEIRHEIDNTTNSERYKLEVLSDFDMIRYIYNTGNRYWKQQTADTDLTPTERNIVNLNFINKCTALGYLLSRYKSPSNAKALYCIETSISEEDEGEHNGGSGKSLFTSLVNYMRNRISVSGQRQMDFNFIYQSIDFDTEIFHIDDLNSKLDLNVFLPDITGDLQVNPKHKSAFILPFAQSPKFSFTSNHAISRFTGSLRRRIFFCEFSDYYHSANEKGMKEMSPKVEFGRDFFTDYSEEDYNTFYNFMLQNVQLYLKHGLIETDMTNIEERQKRYTIGLDFIDWADVYFQDKFNINVDKEEAFTSFKNSLSQRSQSFVKKKTFTKKLQLWCEIKGYTYNPEEIMRYKSETEKKRNEIRWQKPMFPDSDKMINAYGFYIGNKDADMFDNI